LRVREAQLFQKRNKRNGMKRRNKAVFIILITFLCALASAYKSGTIRHGSTLQSCFACHGGGSYRGVGLAVRNYLAPGCWQPGGGNIIAIQGLAARADLAGNITGGDPRMEEWGLQVMFSDENGDSLDVTIIDTDTNNGGVTADTVVNGYTFVEMTDDTLAWWANPIYFPTVSNALWSGMALSFQVNDSSYLGDILVRVDVVLSDEDGTMNGDIPIVSITRLRACLPLDAGGAPWQIDIPSDIDPATWHPIPGGIRFAATAIDWRVFDMKGARVSEGYGAGDVRLMRGLYVVQVGEIAKKVMVR
jgi:hypothetical protein